MSNVQAKDPLMSPPMDELLHLRPLSSREITDRCRFLTVSEPPSPRFTPPEAFLCDGLMDENTPLRQQIHSISSSVSFSFSLPMTCVVIHLPVRGNMDGSFDLTNNSPKNDATCRPTPGTDPAHDNETYQALFMHLDDANFIRLNNDTAMILLKGGRDTNERRLRILMEDFEHSNRPLPHAGAEQIEAQPPSNTSLLHAGAEEIKAQSSSNTSLLHAGAEEIKAQSPSNTSQPHADTTDREATPHRITFEKCMENAVIAHDHAAFFGPGALTFFDDVSLNIFGDRLYHFGRTEEAANAYRKGLERNPRNTNLLNSLAVCHSVTNRLKKARELFERVIELNGQDAISLYNAGLTCHILNDLTAGIHYLQKALHLNEDFYDARLTLGLLQLKAKQEDEAIEHLERAARLHAHAAMPYRILGEFYLSKQNLNKAVSAFTKAIQRNPDDAHALSGLSQAYEIQNKNLEIAADLARHSLVIQPDNPLFMARLGKIYMKMGDFEGADFQFSKAEEQLKETLFLKKSDAPFSTSLEPAMEKAWNNGDVSPVSNSHPVQKMKTMDNAVKHEANTHSSPLSPKQKSA